MIKEVTKRDLFCGYDLTKAEEEVLIKMSLHEFEKPKKERLTPFKLVEKARHYLDNVIRFYE